MSRRLWAVVALLLLTHEAVAFADTASPSASPSPDPSSSPAAAAAPDRHRTFVDVSVDKEEQGQALAVFDDTDVYLTQLDLEKYGVPAEGAACVRIGGSCYVQLKTLAPKVTYTFDRGTLSLAITLAASALPRKNIGLGIQPPEMTNDHVRGNVLNYEINAIANAQVAGVLDDRFGIAKNVVLQGGAGRTTSGLVQRTYTNVVVDAPDVQRRTTYGDTEAAGGDVGGSFEFGGIEVQRQFNLDPYTVNYPTPTLQTAIDQPSQALIFVNGALVKTIDLPPGYYTLSDIPVVAGISNAQVVIRNAYGQTTFNTGTFGGVSLLRKGLTDYQYGVGFLRENLGLPTQSYGPAVATAHYRLGMSDQATIGGLLQWANGLENVGTDYDAQIGAGILHVAASTSIGSGGRSGSSGAIAFTSNTLKSGFGVGVMEQSPNYTLVSSFAPQFQTLGSFFVYWSRQITRLASINLSAQETRYATAGTIPQANLGLTQQMGQWSLSATASVASTAAVAGSPASTTRSLAVTLTRTIGTQATTTMSESVNVQTGPNAASGYQLTSSALSPLTSSYNAVVQSKPGGGAQIGGWTNLASPYGALQIFASPGTQLSDVSATLSGAVVSTSRGTFFTQAVNDGYALVDTGVGGAPVYLSGTYVGKTSNNGAMVVPFLQSNYANNISVSSQGLPLTQILQGEGSQNLAPSYHNGALFKNHVVRVHALVGKLLFSAGANDIVPMYGDAQLRFADTSYKSPIDDEGRVYFQGVMPGKYDLTISVPGKTCTTSVDVPDFTKATFDIGTVRCKIAADGT